MRTTSWEIDKELTEQAYGDCVYIFRYLLFNDKSNITERLLITEKDLSEYLPLCANCGKPYNIACNNCTNKTKGKDHERYNKLL